MEDFASDSAATTFFIASRDTISPPLLEFSTSSEFQDVAVQAILRMCESIVNYTDKTKEM
jgi:hypothetical protein